MWNDDDDWMPSWFRRRHYPFSSSFFDVVEEQFREMYEYMQREFEELSKRAPKDLSRIRVLPDGT